MDDEIGTLNNIKVISTRVTCKAMDKSMKGLIYIGTINSVYYIPGIYIYQGIYIKMHFSVHITYCC